MLLQNLLDVIGNFLTRLVASSELNFLKMFGFSCGSSWLVPSFYGKILTYAFPLDLNQVTLKLLHNSLGFFVFWASFPAKQKLFFPAHHVLKNYFGGFKVICLFLSYSFCTLNVVCLLLLYKIYL